MGESPDKCSPVGLLAVTGWTRRVNAAHVTMNLEVTTAPTDVKARLRAAVCMGKWGGACASLHATDEAVAAEAACGQGRGSPC